MQRTAISKLENGSRESITVGELFVLARALSVPPLLLLCPVGHLERLEILPGHTAEPWEAARWVIGDIANQEERPAWIRPEELPAYRGASMPLVLLREHDRLAREWQRGHREIEQVLQRQSAASDTKLFAARLEFAQREQLRLERELKNIRRRITKFVTVLPKAPENYIDDLPSFDESLDDLEEGAES